MIKIPLLITTRTLKEFNKEAASGGNPKTTPQRQGSSNLHAKEDNIKLIGFSFLKEAGEKSQLKHHDENAIKKKKATALNAHEGTSSHMYMTFIIHGNH